MFKKIIKTVFITSIFASVIVSNSYVEGTVPVSSPLTSTWTVDDAHTLPITLDVNSGGKVDVISTGILTISSTGAINNNNGIIDINASGDIINNGTISNYNTFDNSGILDNNNLVENFAIINNAKTIDNNSSGQIFNIGTIHNSAAINNYGFFQNDVTVNNTTTTGVFHNYGTAHNNLGTFNNDKLVKIHSGVFYNDGTFNNTDDIYIVSPGTFENTTGVIINSFGNIYNEGTFSGAGSITGDFSHTGTGAGTFAPGTIAFPIGTYTINGNYAEGQTLQMQLASASSYDEVVVNGNVTLYPASTLDLDFFGGFTPLIGDTFDILFYTGTLSGTFNTLDLPTTGLPPDSFFDISYDTVVSGGHAVRLTVTESSTVIPEPETYLLFGSFLVVAALLKKKKAHRV